MIGVLTLIIRNDSKSPIVIHKLEHNALVGPTFTYGILVYYQLTLLLVLLTLALGILPYLFYK